MKKIFLSTTLILSLGIYSVNAQTEIQLVKDINTATSSANPSSFIQLNSTQFIFSAYDDVNGQELWISDGTTAGTTLLKDINPSGDSYPSFFKKIGNKFIFSASNGNSNTELWSTDGTTAGTVLIKEIEPSTSNGSTPRDFAEMGGKIYFSATTAAEGRELWVTDGTTAGTTLVKDIIPGTLGSDVTGIFAHNNAIYFTADKGSYNYQIFKSDGTAAGTVVAFELNTTASSNAYIQGVFNGKIYLVGNNGTSGTEVFVSDGTSAGTTLLKDINPTGHSNPQSFYAFDGKLFFIAKETGIAQLWKSDGTTAGTTKVSTMNVQSTNNANAYFTFNNKLYLNGTTVANQVDIYVYDPASNALTLFGNDINFLNVNKTACVVFDNKIYFSGKTPTDGYQLWESDGTASGTTIVDINLSTVTDANLNSSTLFPMGDYLYFNANYDPSLGYELYSLKRTSLSVENPSQMATFNVYPNPATDVLTISTEQAQTLEIFAVNGQHMMSVDVFEGKQFSVAALPSGIYFLKAKGQDTTVKLIKN